MQETAHPATMLGGDRARGADRPRRRRLAAGAAPALVHAQANLRWRLTSSFPKSLDTLWGASQTMARVVGEMTDGKFVLLSGGKIAEVQATAEGATYDEEGLLRLLRLARIGADRIFAAQLDAVK